MRGTHSSEVEPILQYIYLGEATFHQDRMTEFLAVAKSLEIDELCIEESQEVNVKEENVPDDVTEELCIEESEKVKEVDEHTTQDLMTLNSKLKEKSIKNSEDKSFHLRVKLKKN